MFDPWGIIFGPMEAVLLGSNKFNIPKQEEVKNTDCKTLLLSKNNEDSL